MSIVQFDCVAFSKTIIENDSSSCNVQFTHGKYLNPIWVDIYHTTVIYNAKSAIIN